MPMLSDVFSIRFPDVTATEPGLVAVQPPRIDLSVHHCCCHGNVAHALLSRRHINSVGLTNHIVFSNESVNRLLDSCKPILKFSRGT
jgi:hypothetical protein